jgi:hypothetical protein
MITRDLSIREKAQVFENVDLIMENIVSDELALAELTSGTSSDIDYIMEVIAQETANVIIPSANAPLKSGSFQYLDNLTKAVDDTWKRTNMSYFLQNVLPDFDIEMFHLEWLQMVGNANKTCNIASRGLGKSHFWSFGYALWHLYRYKRSTPLLKQPKFITKSKETLIFSNEFKLLKIIIKNIKEEIEENAFLREILYPGSRNADWGKESLKTSTGSSVDIRSYGSSARGLHVYNIIVDDLLNDSVLYNKEANEKFINYYYSVIENILEPGGWIRIVGTPFSQYDLYADIRAKKGFALMEHPIIMPDGSLTYPKKFPINVVEEKLAQQGSLIFSREMLCRPISSDSSIFPNRMLKMALDPTFSRMKTFREAKDKLDIDFTVLGCDFAISANVGADYSVFTTIGVKGNSIETCRLYVLDTWIGKGQSYLEQMNIIKSLNSRFKYRKICMEDNQFQQVFVQAGKKNDMPVFGHTTGTNKYDMRGGLPSLTIWIEQLRLRLPMRDAAAEEMTKVITESLGSIAYTEKGLKSTSGKKEDDSTMSLWKGVVAVREAFSDPASSGEYDFA